MSSKPFKLSLFIFRRDLRMHDNSGLIAACKSSDLVLPCFIFDDRQVKDNDYFSEKAFQFMLRCLADLQKQFTKKSGTLFFFKGAAEKVIERLINELPIDAVFFNRDYTPFSVQRDEAIQKVVDRAKRRCVVSADALLNEPEAVLKSNGTPYTVYTPFMKKSRQLPVLKPQACDFNNFYTQSIAFADPMTLNAQGGRSVGLVLLNKISEVINYDNDRNFPEKNAMTHLSPHHKFGTISVRESHAAMLECAQHTLINEIYWRDFFTHIGFHFPNVFSESFNPNYRAILWSNNLDHFKKWCEGYTGFPIVDAGMRELNETGIMHNRVRMVTASFLVKDLHIDWRWGERYFAQQLMDYDPAVNNGNWQWVASTGCDAQPYFRIFNPWLQQKRFDVDARYIKRWVPELKNIPAKLLHDPIKLFAVQHTDYPKPIVDHATQSSIAKSMYK